jgi:soluble lytic murein transglycosylase-like protein
MRCLLSCVVIVLVACAATATGPTAPVAGAVASSQPGMRDLVRQLSVEHGLDPKLMDALVRVESGYNPRAVSRKGAMGLMQLMPETATRLGVENPFDPEQNVRGGMREFSRLVDRYRGNLQFALAAYNAGEGAVSQYRGVPPYRETRNYVSKILTIYTGRPYRLSGSYRTIPVRMTTDPNTGRTMITNQPSAPASSGLTLKRTAGGSGLLKGGFGVGGD